MAPRGKALGGGWLGGVWVREAEAGEERGVTDEGGWGRGDERESGDVGVEGWRVEMGEGGGG